MTTTKDQANEKFVREFQRRHGLRVDGWAGEKTWASLGVEAHELDSSAFFSSMRRDFGALGKSQVSGAEFLLSAMSEWPVQWVAYGLATAWHESNATMQPVREAYWLSEDWRKKNLRYYPWYGRGYPQTTWKTNYERADKELGLSGTLIMNPDRMLEPEIAARTMVLGMEEGWFTGKSLSSYPMGDYVNYRRIINGTDRAKMIADYAAKFESALRKAGWK